MVIVEGCCDKLQLLISYINNHWLTQKYSEFWLVRYNGLVCSNIAIPALLPSCIYNPWMDGTKCGFLCLDPSIRVRHHCGREESLCLKSLFEGSGQEMIGEWQWDSLLPSQSLSVVSECVSECVSESVHPPSVSEVVMSVGSCQSELRMKYKWLLFAPASLSLASLHSPTTNHLSSGASSDYCHQLMSRQTRIDIPLFTLTFIHSELGAWCLQSLIPHSDLMFIIINITNANG